MNLLYIYVCMYKAKISHRMYEDLHKCFMCITYKVYVCLSILNIYVCMYECTYEAVPCAKDAHATCCSTIFYKRPFYQFYLFTGIFTLVYFWFYSSAPPSVSFLFFCFFAIFFFSYYFFPQPSKLADATGCEWKANRSDLLLLQLLQNIVRVLCPGKHIYTQSYVFMQFYGVRTVIDTHTHVRISIHVYNIK